jgi:hypothetical protein
VVIGDDVIEERSDDGNTTDKDTRPVWGLGFTLRVLGLGFRV